KDTRILLTVTSSPAISGAGSPSHPWGTLVRKMILPGTKVLRFFLGCSAICSRAMRVRFGSCVLDTLTHELRRAGVVQHLSLKAFSFLEFLLERRPSVVSKAEIHDRLWPKTFVSDSSLTRLVSEIRSALGKEADLLRT